MSTAGEQVGGLRERKRRETLQRITEAGIRLFVAKGYDATTLDEIAAEAGISRRTFFYYFKSKDEILLSMQSGFGEVIAAALREAPANCRPLDAARYALVKVASGFQPEEMLVLDRLMRSNPAVQARKQASYVQQEEALFAALRERWPAPERQTALRLVAMLAIGASRLTIETWGRDGAVRPIVELLNEAFNAVEAEI